MSIPISQIIQINPGVIGTGSNPLALNGLILTPSSEVPTGALKTCYTLDDVEDFFGTASAEYAAAVPYFSGNNVRSALAPNALLFTGYTDQAVGAWAKGSSIAGTTLSDLQTVSGTLTVTIDGTKYTTDSLSLSAATSFTDAASIIQTALSLASGQSVAWNSTFSRFEIKSGTSGATSTISAVTGTTAEELGLADATLSQGSAGITPTQAVENAKDVNLNWATFSILFADGALAATKTQHNQDLAKWQATQNNRYLFVAWDDNTDAVDPDGTDTFGQWLQAGNYNVLCCYNTPQVATFAQGIAASINWNAVNGRATLAFKTQEGLDASDAAEKACREVEKDTPMGSYAVSYIQYTVDDSARNYSEITVTIGYKKAEQQLIDIVHATNVSALHDLLTEAAQAGKTELVVQLSAFEGQSYQVQQTVYQVQSAMGGSGWVTNFYPNAANAGVVEILMR